MSTQEARLMTASEVALLLRVHTNTVYDWAKAGHLPVIRYPTGRVRFRREDVEAVFAPNGDTA